MHGQQREAWLGLGLGVGLGLGIDGRGTEIKSVRQHTFPPPCLGMSPNLDPPPLVDDSHFALSASEFPLPIEEHLLFSTHLKFTKD